MDLQRALQAAVQRAVEETNEVGLQVAVFVAGELAAEAWAGYADEGRQRPVDGETLFNVFSATKAVPALAVHLQAERGPLEYQSPVADYWPEFAACGKGQVTVRDVLLHRCGVPQMPRDATAEQMCDWEWMCRAISELEPMWEPGTKSGYHAYTFGWIAGELVRRSDPAHRPFGQWVQEEICAPLGIRDLWLGIPDEVEGRVADILDFPGGNVVPEESPLGRAIPPNLFTRRATFGRHDVRRSCHPGAGGIMNARSLARLYAFLASGKVNGVELLSARRIDEFRQCSTDEADVVIGMSYRRGLGFWLGGAPIDSTAAIIGPNPRAFGHPGAGGSIGWCDPEAGLAVAIVKNQMLAPATIAENPLVSIAEAIRKAMP